MTYTERATAALDTANECERDVLWFWLIKAVVFALLAIAVAVEALHREY